MFNSAAAIYLFGLVFFLIFATAKAQQWGIIPVSRKATRILTRQNSRRRPDSRAVSRQVSSSKTPVSFPSTPEPDAFCAVDLNRDINQMLQSLGDRMVEAKGRQTTVEDRLPSIDELGDSVTCSSSQDCEEGLCSSTEVEFAVLEEEEEEEERLQHYKDRRFSIFP